MKKATLILTAIVLICANSLLIFAQSGGTFQITQSVIASGGDKSTGGTFSLDGTIGQSIAGSQSTGANFTLLSGFWASSGAVSAPRAV